MVRVFARRVLKEAHRRWRRRRTRGRWRTRRRRRRRRTGRRRHARGWDGEAHGTHALRARACLFAKHVVHKKKHDEKWHPFPYTPRNPGIRLGHVYVSCSGTGDTVRRRRWCKSDESRARQVLLLIPAFGDVQQKLFVRKKFSLQELFSCHAGRHAGTLAPYWWER